jgi:hypothetical protein
MIADGLQASPPTTFVPTLTESAWALSGLVPAPNTGVSAQNLASLQNPAILRDAQGRTVKANPLATIDLGNGAVLSFDPTTLDARMTPTVDPSNALYDDSGDSVFTASDCRIMVEVPQTPSFNGSTINSRVAKQLLEATTLSISIHRSKSPVRAFGYINPRGFGRGSRTIAGTLILSKSTAEVLYRFLQSGLVADLSKDTIYTKLDQLPPLDFTLLFSNEQGFASSQRLLGVEFVTDGSVVSIQDMFLEQQITWMAQDFTPLAPLNFNSFFGVPTTPSNAIASQKTVQSTLASAAPASSSAIPFVDNSADPQVNTSDPNLYYLLSN